MPFEIAVDFDGTIFEDDFPGIGDPKTDVIDKLKAFKDHGAEIILWTCREEENLEKAVEACKEERLEFDAVNENSPSRKKMMEESAKKGDVYGLRKIYADIYVDDKALGSIEFFLQIDVAATCESYEHR